MNSAYPLADKNLGRYRSLRLLGAGGMSTVYLATDEELKREVVIKVIRSDLPASMFSDLSERLRREAISIGRLHHPNILQVYDFGEQDGFPYLVMEFVNGGTLKDKMSGPMPWREALALITPVVDALQYAHEQGILHRDIKPANILFRQTGVPLLSDFGIAKILSGRTGEEVTITETGVGIGTPEYMSPEQALGKADDARTDIYAIGVVIFELIAGRRPFTGDTPIAVLLEKVNSPAPALRTFAPITPAHIEQIVAKCLAIKPEDRFGNSGELSQALKQAVQEVPARHLWFPNYFKQLFVSISTRVGRALQTRRKPRSKAVVPPPPKTLIGTRSRQGELTANLVYALDVHRQREIIRLIGRDRELRLKDRIGEFGGGSYLLHGFGRFGGSTLVEQIIEQVKLTLSTKSKDQHAVLAVRVEFPRLSQPNEAASALIKQIRFEVSRSRTARPLATRLQKYAVDHAQKATASTHERTIAFKASPVPGIEASFAQKTGRAPEAIGLSNTSNEDLVDVLARFIDNTEHRKAGFLDALIPRVLANKNGVSRVVLVIDHVVSPALFGLLQNVRIFDDKRISFFVLVKQSDYIKWSTEDVELLDSLGMTSVYVPALWEDKTHFITSILENAFGVSQHEDRVATFRDFVAFTTRGAPGDVVRKVLSHEYCQIEEGVPILDLDSVTDWEAISYGALRQRLLHDNWTRILDKRFVGQEEEDHARIGVYEMMDWMHKESAFSTEAAIERSHRSKVPISPSKAVREATVRALLDVCVSCEYLAETIDSDRYVVNRRLG